MKKGKGADKGPSKKTEQKYAAKVVEDKTFGLKNKNKSKTVQNYVKSVTNQIMNKNQKGGAEKQLAEEFKAKAEKKKEQEQKALLQSLFTSMSAIAQTQLKEGEDPKSVLCAYFKAGVCEKGKKCKFAHDLALEGKSAKINMYADPRDKNGIPPERCDIICQDFLDAVEKNVYGWLWECPNGGSKCVYRHALPQGYVLNREKKEAERLAKEQADMEDEKTIEEIIEEERAKLEHDKLTPVNPTTFAAWKVRKAEDKQKALEEKLKEAQRTQGKKGGSNIMSGKALFTYNPTLFQQDDENAADEKTYEERNEDMEAVKEEGKEEESEDEGTQENGNKKKKDAPSDVITKTTVDTSLFQAEADNQEEEVDFD